MPLLLTRATQLLRTEDGSGTLASLFILTACLALGGAAVDIGNGLRVREVLQANAESAALSAAVRASEPVEGDSPAQVARRIATAGLAPAGLTDAWHDESFELGTVDPVTRSFVPLPDLVDDQLADAVRVTLNRTDRLGNPEPLLFSHLLGHAPWNISGRAVAQIRTRAALDCPDPLLSLQTRVDVSTRNVFLGVCLYANATVDYGTEPAWKSADTDFVLNKLVAGGLGLPDLDLFGVTGPLQADDVERIAKAATSNVSLNDLGDISVVSNGSLYVRCDENEVLRLGDGFVVENAALYSECPVRFEGEVSLNASLVVGNLTSLLEDLHTVDVTPDAILTGSPDCAPGDGVQVLLFADLDAVAGIPALVSADSPLGQYIDETIEGTGGVVSDTLDVLGGLVNPLVEEVSDITTDLQMLPICLNARTMLNSDTVVLR